MVLCSWLATASIEEVDNGKGLQCHTAPHSWKLIVECTGKMYEMVFTACSAPEESVWKTRLAERIATETRRLAEGHAKFIDIQSSLAHDMKSIGKAFGKASGFVRRLSVHRSATLGPTTDLNQVIIKNTQAIKDVVGDKNASTASLPIPRSQSVMTPSHIPTLAPRRSDRSKLEEALSDVWTKDLIPYPGMLRRSTEHHIRASANSVMRKLSMASLASNFSMSKRSASYSSVAALQSSALSTLDLKRGKPESKEARPPKSRRKPLIDFHNAPEAFLPEDFVLDNTKKRPAAFRTSTMLADRPRSPFFSSHSTGENKAPGLNRQKTKLLKFWN